MEVLMVFNLRMRGFPRTEFLTMCVGKNYVRAAKYKAFTRAKFFNMWLRLSVCR